MASMKKPPRRAQPRHTGTGMVRVAAEKAKKSRKKKRAKLDRIMSQTRGR